MVKYTATIFSFPYSYYIISINYAFLFYYAFAFTNMLNTGLTTSETIIPIVPASCELIPNMYKLRQVTNPITEEEIAPNLFTLLLKSPQMKGPKNTEPIAPHDIPKIATIESGFNKAIITDIKTKKALPKRIKRVSLPSLMFLLINPA